jgi:hypothetical protein
VLILCQVRSIGEHGSYRYVEAQRSDDRRESRRQCHPVVSTRRRLAEATFVAKYAYLWGDTGTVKKHLLSWSHLFVAPGRCWALHDKHVVRPAADCVCRSCSADLHATSLFVNAVPLKFSYDGSTAWGLAWAPSQGRKAKDAHSVPVNPFV